MHNVSCWSISRNFLCLSILPKFANDSFITIIFERVCSTHYSKYFKDNVTMYCVCTNIHTCIDNKSYLYTEYHQFITANRQLIIGSSPLYQLIVNNFIITCEKKTQSIYEFMSKRSFVCLNDCSIPQRKGGGCVGAK